MKVERALEGIKAVEVGEHISAAYCTKLLADMGAEVIKIEPLQGDSSRRSGPFPNDRVDRERSGLFLFLNANKLGVTLNLETDTGRKMLKQLVRDVDILITNRPPENSSNLGLTYKDLKSLNERLIVGSVTPYGKSGELRNYKGYCINAAGLGGVSLVVGEPGREPLTPPLSFGNYLSGAMTALGVNFALLARETSGKGQEVDVSESDTWASLIGGQAVSSYVFHERKRMRSGHRTPGFYPYTILPCKDGYISMIAVQGAEWKKFLELVGGGKIPNWYDEDDRFKDRWVAGRDHADALDSLLGDWLQAHSKEEIFRLCREKHIPFAPVRKIAEVANDTHFEGRQYFVELEDGRGSGQMYPGAPYRFSRTKWMLKFRAPKLGEHNHEVYSRIGYSKEDLVDLSRTGII